MAEDDPSALTCSECNAVLRADARFCDQCGTPVDPAPEPVEGQEAEDEHPDEVQEAGEERPAEEEQETEESEPEEYEESEPEKDEESEPEEDKKTEPEAGQEAQTDPPADAGAALADRIQARSHGGNPAARRRLIAVVISVLAWAGIAFFLYQKTPDWIVKDAEDSVASGQGVAGGVQELCADPAHHDRLVELWQDADAENQRRIELAMSHFGCLELLPEDAQARFYREVGAWVLENLPPGEDGLDRLLDVFVNGEAEVRAAAARELAARREMLSESGARRALEVARSHDQPWSIDLLDALGTPSATDEIWSRLQAMAPTDPERARLLKIVLRHWDVLSPAAREALVEQWVDVRWVLRRVASATQPQPFMLEVEYQPPRLAGALDGATLVAWVESVTIDGEEAEMHGQPVASQFATIILTSPGRNESVVDLEPILTQQGWMQIAATLRYALLPGEISKAEMLDGSGQLLPNARAKALFEREIVIEPVRYRVNLNVNRGYPDTIHDREVDTQVRAQVDVSLETREQVVRLRSGGALSSNRAVVSARHGVPIDLLLSVSNPLPTELAFRVQGRSPNSENQWRELGTGVFRTTHIIPGDRTTARFDVELSPVCQHLGRCSVELRLQDSLYIGRTDARVASYWGESLQLGTVAFELENVAPGLHWQTMQEQLTERAVP